ncbi:triose-phosphate isomerase [Pararhodobacter oceanensis]|uniref:triose-phosphate isomerase n=1 Tax=Pararhodobacter oceanensis TaxID=2172121 RepID=UPI003A9467FE
MTAPKLVAGNWKMNGRMVHLEEALGIATASAAAGDAVDVLLCPPATLLAPMASALTGSNTFVGGQDCHAQQSGAHTGEVSAAMLVDAGATHVILGHSERRRDHHESSADIAAKVQAAWSEGLVAILCIGETEAERDAGSTLTVLAEQLSASLPEDATPETTVIAYEPVWAIGTGRTPSLEQIAEAHAAIRAHVPAGIRLLYGGSVTPQNAAAIFATDNVDGALVGGASLKAEDFTPIIDALKNA